MKRVLLLSGSILLITGLSFGQAMESTVDYKRVAQPAAVIDLPYPPSVVEDAMNDYLSKKGKSKANNLKGFTAYRNTQATVNDSANADMYFKVERKSRDQKDVSVVSLLLASPNENPAATPGVRRLNMEEAKTYLNELSMAIQNYDLELQIKNQNDAVTKAETNYKNLVDEGNDLEKKRLNIDEKITQNKAEQDKQKLEIEKQKQALTVLVDNRKA
jgi:hypothetical protein